MNQEFDVAIVGAGIVGLATAYQLTRERGDRRVVVLEKEKTCAAHQTGHNSGVIHSGLYYPPGSAKARTCVAGAQLLKDFCREHGIRVVVCGKVVVASEEFDLAALEELYRRGSANGVPGLALVGRERLREIEPHVEGIRALHVPDAALVDYSKVAEKLVDLLRAAGGEVRMAAELRDVREEEGGFLIDTTQGNVRARYLIGCAGLHSDRVARIEGADPGVRIVPFRGEYYRLVRGRSDLVRGLVYSVPNRRLPFLGPHFTRKVDGGIEAGPNAVLAFHREGYTGSRVSLRDLAEVLTYPGFWRMARRHWRAGLGEAWRSMSKKAFVRSLARLVPEIRSKDLEPGRAGVRAQALSPTGRLLDDFLIVERPRALHVCNAPSPAATASLAIGDEITRLAAERFWPEAATGRQPSPFPLR
jgi:L-2-hydroxyglutarate oxidase LhgO